MHEQPRLYSADFAGCAELSSFEAPALADMFAGALIGAGATIVHRAMHAFPGGGLTCVLILAESHAVLHTWPETGTVNIDIFSCSPRLRSLAAVTEIGRRLGAREIFPVQETARVDGHSRAQGHAGRQAL